MAFLQQRIVSANAFLQGLRGSDDFTHIEASQRDCLLRIIAVTHVALVDEAVVRLTIAGASEFTEGSRAMFGQSLKVVVGKCHQEYTHFPAYLSDEQWQSLAHATEDDALEFASQFVHSLGCQSASEPTAAQVAGFALAVACKSTLEAIAKPKDLKRATFLAAKRRLAALSSPGGEVSARNLPHDPRQFMAEHAAAYARALAGGSHSHNPRLSVAAISSVAATIPQRDANNGRPRSVRSCSNGSRSHGSSHSGSRNLT